MVPAAACAALSPWTQRIGCSGEDVVPSLRITLMDAGQPISATYSSPDVSSTALSGGVVVLGPITMKPRPTSGYIAIDSIRVELVSPGVPWHKDFGIRTTGDGTVVRVTNGTELTVVFDDPAHVLAVERSPAAISALRKLVASIPDG
jgi:hypothetical protein